MPTGRRSRAPVAIDINSIEDVLEAIGITDTRHSGGQITARCPVHEEEIGVAQRDRTRTWRIHPESGLWYCFSCRGRGNLSQLVQRVTGGELDDDDIGRFIVRSTVQRAAQRQADRENMVMHAPKRIDEGAYQAYDLVPANRLHDRNISTWAGEHCGLRWDPDERSWIIPIRDPQTFDVWGWQEKRRDGEVRNWPVGVEKSVTLFGIEHIERGVHRLVVVESPLDVVRLDTIDIPAVATYGAATSDAQIELLETLSPRVLVDGYDNDSAGLNAGRSLRDRYRRRCLRLYYGQTKAKDVGDMSDAEVRFALDNARSPFTKGLR